MDTDHSNEMNSFDAFDSFDVNDHQNQTIRVLKIIYLLQQNWHSVAALQRKLSLPLSERSTYRDIELIQKFLGKSVQKNTDNEYRIMPDQWQTFLAHNLTIDEAFAIFLLCKQGCKQPVAVPYLQALDTGMQKLFQLLPAKMQSDMMTQLQHMDITLSKAKPLSGKEEICKQIWEARWKRFCVQIHYDSIAEGELITILQPYHVQFCTHSWYVIGRSEFHQDVRIFNIERILSLKPLPDRLFVLPFGWSYENFRGNSWNMFRSGEDCQVHLHFKSWIARNVSAAQWHKTQRIVQNPDGSIEFYATVAGFAEIQWWILGYGDSVEVISPPELRKIVRERIRFMAEIYRKDP